MNIRLLQHNSSDYSQMLDLRLKVLLNPIGIPASFIQTEKEKNDYLIGAFEGAEIVGCCVLTPKENKTVQLRQMAVLQSLQGTGIGAAIVAFAEKIAFEKGFETLLLHARSHVTSFYLKCGYTIVGEPFEEVGIEHRIMQKQLQ